MPYQIAILATPSFNALATLAFIDPFRAANYLDNRALYRWRLFSGAGGLLRASNGLALGTEPLSAADDWTPDMAVISSSWTPEAFYADERLMGRIRRWGRGGVTLVGLDTGAFILAEAGQLEGRRAACHYEHIDALQEVHPQTVSTEQLFVVDGDVLTCAGGAASIDLALNILRLHHGDALANASARYIFHDRLRLEGETQNPTGYEPIGQTTPAALREAILLMERHLEEPLPAPEIARRIGRSHRHLTRLFRQYTKKSLVQYYRDIRLDRGRALVTQTEMSVLEIALACGFASPEHFARAYRARFAITPRADRVAGRVPFEFRAWPMHPQGRKG